MINCTGRAGTDGLPSADGASCTCLNSTVRYWNPANLSCYFNCSQRTNVLTGISNPTSCVCAAPFTWSLTLLDCALDCSNLYRATNNSNATACNCQPPFFWNPLSMDCDVNCSNYTCAKPGIYDEVVSSTQACECAHSYLTWKPSITGCYLDC